MRATAARFAEWLESDAGRRTPLEDIGRTLAERARCGGDVRTALVARDHGELARGLRAVAARHHAPPVLRSPAPGACGPSGLVWVFPGSGTPWPGMGARLLAAEPGFAAAVDELEPVLLDECGVSLRAALEAGSGAGDGGAEGGGSHVVRYGTQLALAALWRRYGVRPAAVLGHASGEVTAAVVAGTLTPREGARLVQARARVRARARHAAGTGREGAAPVRREAESAVRDARFRRAVALAVAEGATGATRAGFLEISPHPVLAGPLAHSVRATGAGEALIVPTLRRADDAAVAFRTSLAALFVHGAPVDLRQAHSAGKVRELPTAPGIRDAVSADAAGAAYVADRLARMVAVVMGHAPERGDHLDRTVPLTELGLDSLMGARVRLAAEHEFGLVLPVRLMLHGTTIDEAAACVAARMGGRSGTPAVPPSRPAAPADTAPSPAYPRLRRLRAGSGDGEGDSDGDGAGDAPPLFLAHPVDGPASVYQALADRLPAGTAVYGLERPESPGGAAERAALCAEWVRAVRPHGPYRLGGWSLGGFLAIETARLLAAGGEEVESVVLIDPVRPHPVRDAGDGADAAVAPAPYEGRVLLCRAMEPAPRAALDDGPAPGWDEICPRLRVVTVPGHHLSLLEPPYVNALAAHVASEFSGPVTHRTAS
ncbi:acyltransferase domain-containing protein [Streptomyces daliensis]